MSEKRGELHNPMVWFFYLPGGFFLRKLVVEGQKRTHHFTHDHRRDIMDLTLSFPFLTISACQEIYSCHCLQKDWDLWEYLDEIDRTLSAFAEDEADDLAEILDAE